jgi:hypothetical protein
MGCVFAGGEARMEEGRPALQEVRKDAGTSGSGGGV